MANDTERVVIKDKEIYVSGHIGLNEAMKINEAIIDINKKDKEREANAAYMFSHIDPPYTRRPIKIYLTSYGGYLAASQAVVNVMDTSETPIHTISLGVSSSAAFNIFMLGDERVVGDLGKLMYHQGYSSTEGTVNTMAKDIDSYKTLVKQMREFIVKKLPKAKTKKVLKLFEEYDYNNQDLNLTPEEALELGVATTTYKDYLRRDSK